MGLMNLFKKTPAAASTSGQIQVDTGPQILVVDDDPLYCKLIQEHSKKIGVRVKILNPTDSVSTLKGQTFDAAIVDYDLGNTDGLTLIRGIEKELGRVPTILVSGSSRDDIPSEAWPSVLVEFVPKSAGYLEALMCAFDFCKRREKNTPTK